MNARKCKWCNTYPCPYPTDEDFYRQLAVGGQEWLRKMPCWTPIPENIGDLYTEDGQMLPNGYNFL